MMMMKNSFGDDGDNDDDDDDYEDDDDDDEMMNCFCGMVDQRKTFNLISCRNHCQRSSPFQISDMPLTGFGPAQTLVSGFAERSCAVVITTM